MYKMPVSGSVEDVCLSNDRFDGNHLRHFKGPCPAIVRNLWRHIGFHIGKACKYNKLTQYGIFGYLQLVSTECNCSQHRHHLLKFTLMMMVLRGTAIHQRWATHRLLSDETD